MIDTFKTALDAAGLSTKEKISPDGRMHRFHVDGDRPGSKNGWYVLVWRWPAIWRFRLMENRV
jgi:putative DNA primase/helicase